MAPTLHTPMPEHHVHFVQVAEPRVYVGEVRLVIHTAIQDAGLEDADGLRFDPTHWESTGALPAVREDNPGRRDPWERSIRDQGGTRLTTLSAEILDLFGVDWDALMDEEVEPPTLEVLAGDGIIALKPREQQTVVVDDDGDET